MTRKKKVPEIRFEGFSREWEENELGVIAKFSKGRGYSKSDLVEYGTPIILYGRLYTQYNSVISEVDTYAIAKKDSIYSKGKEVIVPASGETAEDISRAAAVCRSDILLGGDLNIIYPGNKIDSVFLAFNISNGKPQRELSKKAQGKSIVHLHNTDLQDILINYPEKVEQSQISTFLQNLDSLIALQLRKYDKLITVKKSMLEKMFPQDGADVPEIRFKRFTDNWMKCKLSDCLESSTDKNIDNVFTKNDVLSVSGDVGIVNQIEFQGRSFAGVSVANYGIVRHGEIVYTKSPLKANPFGIIKTNKGDDGIVSTLYAIYKTRKSIDSNFVENYFDRNDRLNHYLKPLVNKGAKNDMKVTSDNALKGKVIFPKTKDEQETIASFFRIINNLISLQQRELDILKNLKKACLTKMFV